MLVKLPGGRDLAVPSSYLDDPDIGAVLEVMTRHDRDVLDGLGVHRYAYLTVDSRVVPGGRTHRNSGWHFDGMQGERYASPLPVCYQYVWASAIPTEYSDAPTSTAGLSVTRHNWFTELGAQVPDCHPVTTYPDGSILLMSAYQLHRSPTVTATTSRLFVRLDYSFKRQDRLGNTVNPLLPAPWQYVPRDMPAGLSSPVDDAGWQ
jgi:hypothetical protein